LSAQLANYYKVLGIDACSDDLTIKSAYRRLARRYHPDVAAGTHATRQFLLIREAYEVLSDPQKRRQYDRLLSMRAASRPSRARARPGVAAGRKVSQPRRAFGVTLDVLGLHIEGALRKR
jgi:DnaJ-class molecular chaperone